MAKKINAHAIYVSFTEDALLVVLADDRELSVPLSWFPRLLKATQAQREDWELISDGIGIHWPIIDVYIEVKSLLAT